MTSHALKIGHVDRRLKDIMKALVFDLLLLFVISFGKPENFDKIKLALRSF